MQLSFLIVDDEKNSRKYLSSLIHEFVPEAIVHEASSAKVALSIIPEVKADVLFLDIKMPGQSGFELLDLIPERDFELVFITAYGEYAINAIKEGAADYLLKPIRKSDFKETIQKLVTKCGKKKIKSNESVKEIDEKYLNNKLTINQQRRVIMVQLRDIVYLQANNSYTTIFLSDGEKVTTTKPIHRFEHILNEDWFFRIHKSYIINIYHFKEYSSREENIAIMDTGDKLSISRYRNSEFLEKIRTVNIKLKI